MTPARLGKTLTDPQKRVCRALAEAYEEAGRGAEALVLYKKLSRYRNASAAIKKKVDRLKGRCVSARAHGDKRVESRRTQRRLAAHRSSESPTQPSAE